MYNPYNLEANTTDETIRNFKKYLMVQKIASGSIRSYLSDTRFFFNWLVNFLEEKHVFIKSESPSLSLRGGGTKDPSLHSGQAPQSQTTQEDRLLRGTAPRNDNFGRNDDMESLLKFVNEAVLNSYKNSLESSNIPAKTINRRFSALRKFGSFAKDQNWIPSVFESLRNISPNTPFPESKYHLGEFKASLWKNKASKSTIKNYLNDSKQFLLWIKSSKFKSLSRACRGMQN